MFLIDGYHFKIYTTIKYLHADIFVNTNENKSVLNIKSFQSSQKKKKKTAVKKKDLPTHLVIKDMLVYIYFPKI